jgi:hypothetical protein
VLGETMDYQILMGFVVGYLHATHLDKYFVSYFNSQRLESWENKAFCKYIQRLPRYVKASGIMVNRIIILNASYATGDSEAMRDPIELVGREVMIENNDLEMAENQNVESRNKHYNRVNEEDIQLL